MRDHDKDSIDDALVASVGGVRVVEGLLLGDDPAEGLEPVLGLGEGPHVDLALVVVLAVHWGRELVRTRRQTHT